MNAHSAENGLPQTFGGGGYYAYDAPTLDRADLHGCLDEDVNTGDPLVCRECAFPPAHNHDAIGVYGNCPACGTVIPPAVTDDGGAA